MTAPTDTTFIAGTVITSSWLNGVNDHVNNLISDPHPEYVQETALALSTGSSLVGFLQSGTGAVARMAQDKMREWVSVFDFMTDTEIYAVQNNDYSTVTDVTAAINAAFASFPRQGTPYWQPFVLVFPPGYYKVTSKLVPEFQQHGEFIGYGATIYGDFNDTLFQYGMVGKGMIWHTLRGFTFEQHNTGASAKAFDMRDVYSCSIVDCFFYGGQITGYLQGNNNVFMQCTWRGKSGGTTKLMVGGEGSNNQNNTFLNCAFEQVGGFGLCLQSDTQYAGQTVVKSCYFEFCDPVALYIKNNQSVTVEDCYFNLSGNTGGIRMDGGIGPAYTDSKVVVRNNDVFGHASSPSFVLECASTAPNVLFENNRLASGSTDPVNFYGNAPNSVNLSRKKKTPLITNATSIVNTDTLGAPDGWTLGGSGNVAIVAAFSPYIGADYGAASIDSTNSYIYQQVYVPAGSLIRISVYARVATAPTTAALQLWSVGLGEQYKAASTGNASATKLELYLNATERSSATSFLILLRNTGGDGAAQFCDLEIEDMTA